jgi:hypothetical protein
MKYKGVPGFKKRGSPVIVYTLRGRTYVRAKSSLTSKRVKTSKEFKLTMINAGLLAKASKIASEIYRALPEKKRKHSFYRLLTGKAMKMLKTGMSEEEVKKRLP